MYSKLTELQKDLLKESFHEAGVLGAVTTIQAVYCAARDVLVDSDEEWNGPVGQDAFAAAMAHLIMEKSISVKTVGLKTHAKQKQLLNQVGNYYTYPNVGWWKLKEEHAKTMSMEQLVYARQDCHVTATEGMPENEGKYKDEGSIYAKEIMVRSGGVDVKGVH